MKVAGKNASVTLLAGCLSVNCVNWAQAEADKSDAEVCPVPKVIEPLPGDSSNWPAWVEHRVAELQPLKQERKIDQIGWSHTILGAEKLAREHNRPVFLFTHDGRMNTGRC